jgi:hypothetical protein
MSNKILAIILASILCFINLDVIAQNNTQPYLYEQDAPNQDSNLVKKYSKNIQISKDKLNYIITPDSKNGKIKIDRNSENPCKMTYSLKEIIDDRYAIFDGSSECDGYGGIFIDLRSGYLAENMYDRSVFFSPNKKRVVTIGLGDKIEIFEPKDGKTLSPDDVSKITFGEYVEFSSWKSDDELVVKTAPLDPEVSEHVFLDKEKITYGTFSYNSKLKKWEEKKIAKTSTHKGQYGIKSPTQSAN